MKVYSADVVEDIEVGYIGIGDTEVDYIVEDDIQVGDIEVDYIGVLVDGAAGTGFADGTLDSLVHCSFAVVCNYFLDDRLEMELVVQCAQVFFEMTVLVAFLFQTNS